MSPTERLIPQNVFIPLILDVTPFLSTLRGAGAGGDGEAGITASAPAEGQREARSGTVVGSGNWQPAGWAVHYFHMTCVPRHRCVPPSTAPWGGKL